MRFLLSGIDRLRVVKRNVGSTKISCNCHGGLQRSVLLAGQSLLMLPVSAGSRAKIYSFMFSAGLAGMSIGPCAAAATFAVTGNKWDVDTLQHVILVGMALAVLPILALLCFDDDQSLGPESDAVRQSYTSLREVHVQAAFDVYASATTWSCLVSVELDHVLSCVTTFSDCTLWSAYYPGAIACATACLGVKTMQSVEHIFLHSVCLLLHVCPDMYN